MAFDFSRLFRVAGIVLLSLTATDARADIRAVYGSPDNPRQLTVEVSDDGALRFGADDSGYMLMLGDKAYQVMAGPGGPQVIAVDAIAYLARQDVANGTVIAISVKEPNEKPQPNHYAAGAKVTVAGYAGIEYNLTSSDRAPMVLTDDARLLMLGKAWLSYDKTSVSMMTVPVLEADLGNLFELLANHGVLGVGDRNLISVSFEPIDRTRFAIPAPALTLEDVTKSASASISTGGYAQRKPSVIRAKFHENVLVTLTDDGAMQSWHEGAIAGEAIATPERVVDFCTSKAELYLMTANVQEKRLNIWSGAPGKWARISTWDGAGNETIIAMDCSGIEPILLTNTGIRVLRTGKVIPVAGQNAGPRGYTTTLQHNGYLYIGINAGEWGGGLRRYPISGGAEEPVDASDPSKLCGGVLNMTCNPVTGLAPDPVHHDCILATTGLTHMMSFGSVLRICDRAISVVYEKAYTIDAGWHFDPAHPHGTGQSVPFYSLGAGNAGVWAVASDGVYQFGKGALPDFHAFPRVSPPPVNIIDWSNRDYVLVTTNMNQARSLSGRSLILVPR